MPKYYYEDAVKYLENNGLNCDPTSGGERVCDLLDKAFDGCDYISEAILDDIIDRLNLEDGLYD